MALRLPAAGGSSTPDTFSTDEVLTNKVWVDGKAVYRKVVNCGALPNNATKTVAHGIPNPKTILRVHGFAVGIPVPCVTTTSLPENVQLWVDGTNINLRTGTDRTAHNPTWVELEYTK